MDDFTSSEIENTVMLIDFVVQFIVDCTHLQVKEDISLKPS